MKKYGECQIERDTLDQIEFLREMKQMSYQKIADQLNIKSCFPRKAQKWTWFLVRWHYLNSNKTRREAERMKIENTA